MNRITIPALAEMKRQGRKIVGVVAWDTPMAQLAERAGVDLLSVGTRWARTCGAMPPKPR